MKNRLVEKSLIIFFFIICISSTALSAPDPKINYQGRLEKAGELITGTKTIVFKIYDAKTGGNLIWQSGEQSVNIIQGFFNYPLGNNTPLPTDIFSQKTLYLEIIIESSIMSPREEILMPPYAERSQLAYGVDWSNITNIPAGFADGTDDSSGSGALTADSIGNYHIIDSTITTADITDNAITNAKLAANAVTNAKIASNAAISLSKLEKDPSQTGTINNSTNPVDWSQLKNVPADFADGTDNTNGSIGADSIGTYHVINGSITASDIADGTITDTDISATAAIVLSKLAKDPSQIGTINTPTNPVDWSQLKNVPSVFADGTDDGTADNLGNHTATQDIVPTSSDTLRVGTASLRFLEMHTKEIFIGNGSLYMNGKKVLESSASTLKLSGDTGQNIQLQTLGSGNLQLSPAGTGDLELTTSISGDIKLTSNDDIELNTSQINGNISLNATGTNSQIQLSAQEEIDFTAPIVDVNGTLRIGNFSIDGDNYDVSSDGVITASTITATGRITAAGGNSDNWNTTYSWGDHSLQTYITYYSETDPLYSTAPASGITDAGSGSVIASAERAKLNYALTYYTETDPIYSVSASTQVTQVKITNWDNTYSWGDHSTAGYITDNQNIIYSTHIVDGEIADADINDVAWGKITSIPADLADGDDTGLDSQNVVYSTHIVNGEIVDADINDVAWSKITSVPSDLADGDDTGLDSQNVVYSTHIVDGEIADADINDVAWGKITSVPSDLADGDDDNELDSQNIIYSTHI
ncbi:hypothetical protein ACFL4O_00830, partial [bacterium]